MLHVGINAHCMCEETHDTSIAKFKVPTVLDAKKHKVQEQQILM